MTTEVRVPALGESVTEATIATWFKKPGDRVEVDEMLCELETDKVTVEVPSPAAGTLAEIVAAEMRNAQDDPGPLVEDDEQSSPGSAGGEPVDDGGDDVKDRGDEIGAVKHGRVSEVGYPGIVGEGSCHSHAHGSGPSSEWSDGGHMLGCDMAMTTPSSMISRMSGGSSSGS